MEGGKGRRAAHFGVSRTLKGRYMSFFSSIFPSYFTNHISTFKSLWISSVPFDVPFALEETSSCRILLETNKLEK